ncbi:MAG: LptA/OstA family protein [Candidatus Auribacterota bacterium]|nr:LptA/OstA family protein [Candidatus Auribacterota bacterium]
MKRVLIFFSLYLFLSSLSGAGAEESVKEEDWTIVTCDGNLLMDYKNQRVIFFNNVLVKNPRGSLQADRMIIFFTPDGKKVDRVEAEGNIRIRMEEKAGTSDKVIYYPEEKKAVLLGHAVVSSGLNRVQGGMIIFFLDKKEMEVQDTPDIQYIPDEDYDVTF